MKKKWQLIFPHDRVQQPLVWELSKKFNIVFNLRRAKITESVGEILLELEGEPSVVAASEAWLREKGVRVEPVTHDTLES